MTREEIRTGAAQPDRTRQAVAQPKSSPMTTKGFDGVRFLRRVLWIVFVISLAGVAFSATLSYLELRGAVASCPAVGAPGTIFGMPACVYGLGMYTILAALSGFGLFHTRPRLQVVR